MASIHHQNAVNCVKGEIHNVLSVMRVNQRWASEARFHQEIAMHTESPLMRSFKILHKDLEVIDDLNDFDTVQYLEPFLQVIESPRTSGIITGSAVSSINKFLLYGFINKEVLRATEAINRIATAVSNCRFEETHRETDEMVLMKLLELLEYSLRSQAGPLITSKKLFRMVRVCYGISRQEQSSIHLCHTAENTLAHLILTVFSRLEELSEEESEAPSGRKDLLSPIASTTTAFGPVRHDSNNSPSCRQHSNEFTQNMETMQVADEDKPYGISSLRQILEFLTSLIDLNGSGNDESTMILGLGLINIVLETAGTTLSNYPSLVSVLHGDLSKFLLQNSETNDLTILSLCLRVVFNLFNSIKDHLKVQLEVFFTSVHMRILDSPSCTVEQKEIAMESLVEFCREPALMLDLYVNYDCDVHCTNLFEVLCASLAKNAQQENSSDSTKNNGSINTIPNSQEKNQNMENTTIETRDDDQQLNVINLLALEGLLAVIDSIARRCPNKDLTNSNMPSSVPNFDLTQLAQSLHPLSSITDVMERVMSGSEGGSDIDEDDIEEGFDIEDEDEGRGRELSSFSSTTSSSSANSPMSLRGNKNIRDLNWLQTARERTAEVLQQRKKTKKRLLLASEKFNSDQKHWIEYAQQLGFLPSPSPDALSVALFLKNTPGLNKTLIGDYLGEGPVDKYPFNEAVRKAYVSSFDFSSKRIDEALRMFLSKFRLPGEAQKIERLMEIFSSHYYHSNTSSVFTHEDCAFVLSYSIIMLNTDLHNKQVVKKMSLDEFIRNNRGINEGKDLPNEYLEAIYESISRKEIMMTLSSTDTSGATSLTSQALTQQWNNILKRNESVVGASFTSNASIKKFKAGIYEREMFKLIKKKVLQSLQFCFTCTLEESLLNRIFDGIENYCRICVYFDLTAEFNEVLGWLCKSFQQFSRVALNGERVCVRVGKGRDEKEDRKHEMKRIRLTNVDEWRRFMFSSRSIDSLEVAFRLMKTYSLTLTKDGWKNVVECILCLNELDVLPTSLVEMDDFVDARGVPLPSSLVYKQSTMSSADSSYSNGKEISGMSARVRERGRKRAERQAAARAARIGHHHHGGDSTAAMSSQNQYYSSGHGANSSGGLSLWDSLSSFLWSEEETNEDDLSDLTRELVVTVDRIGLEQDKWNNLCRLIPLQSLKSLTAALIEARDPFVSNGGVKFNNEDFVMAQENAILALELVINLVLVNRNLLEMKDCWTIIHSYFHRIFSTSTNMNLLVERVLVNIFRVCIRLFHKKEDRDFLMPSLSLIRIHLSKEYVEMFAERISSGVFMLVKANAMYLNGEDEWKEIFHLLARVIQLDVPSSEKSGKGKECALEVLAFLNESNFIKNSTFNLWKEMVLLFLSSPSSSINNTLASKAIRLIQSFCINLTNSQSSASGEGKDDDGNLVHADNSNRNGLSVDDCWLTSLSILHHHLDDPRAMVARTSWESMKTVLLLPSSSVSLQIWEKCFDEILFTLETKIREDVWDNKEEGRLRCNALLSKSFLHRVQTLSESETFPSLWFNVLRKMANDLRPESSQNDRADDSYSVVYETTIHALYNILTIMSAEGIFEKIQERGYREGSGNLFNETWDVLDDICPQVRSQIGPPISPVNQANQSPSDAFSERVVEHELVDSVDGSTSAETIELERGLETKFNEGADLASNESQEQIL